MLPAPIVRIDKQNEFSVSHFYLDDFDRSLFSVVNIDYDNPSISDDIYKMIIKMIYVLKSLDDQQNPNKLPAVLIFLPGIFEINTLHKQIELFVEK